jgi:hypothetical protein
MTDLSPAAQAVLDAFLGDCEYTGLQMDDLRENVAAALRAAADQVVTMRPHGGRAWSTEQVTAYDVLTKATDHLLAIAAELETSTTETDD